MHEGEFRPSLRWHDGSRDFLGPINRHESCIAMLHAALAHESDFELGQLLNRQAKHFWEVILDPTRASKPLPETYWRSVWAHPALWRSGKDAMHVEGKW